MSYDPFFAVPEAVRYIPRAPPTPADRTHPKPTECIRRVPIPPPVPPGP